MNKNFTFLIMVTIMGMAGQAQIAKGSLLLGGSLGFSNTTEESSNTKQSTFIVSPVAGIVLKENTVVGASLKYGHSDKTGLNDYSTYGAGLFLRKYRPLGKGFYLFGEGNLRFDYVTYTQEYTSGQGIQSYEVNEYSLGAGFNPGISYQLTRRLHLEMVFTDLIGIYYSRREREGTTPPFIYEKSKLFSLNSNISVNGINSIGIGIRFLLAR